mgnify:CR=1 FL=1
MRTPRPRTTSRSSPRRSPRASRTSRPRRSATASRWTIEDNVYLSDMEHSAVVGLGQDRRSRRSLKDPRLRWPDGFSFGPGRLALRHLQLAAERAVRADAATMRAHAPYQIFRFSPASAASPATKDIHGGRRRRRGGQSLSPRLRASAVEIFRQTSTSSIFGARSMINLKRGSTSLPISVWMVCSARARRRRWRRCSSVRLGRDRGSSP